MKEQVYSFDIFDTLITRTVAEPVGIFLFIQEQIQNFDLPPFLKNNFAKIRQETEYFSQENQLELNNKFDTTLDEIYKVIKNNYCLSDEMTEKIKQIEINSEIENVYPLRENINKLKNLVCQGKKVILISDMYLSSDVLKKMLIKVDNIFDNIEIYVSSETGRRKSNGSLYRKIKEKYDIIEHFGDCYFSDAVQAKWNGIRTERYLPEAFKPYEKVLLNKFPRNLFIQKSIGISRAIREDKKSHNGIYDFAVSFAAPVLYGYVDWVLKEAVRRNIKNLYFVARDGFVPKVIADIIIREKNYAVNTNYFYSSRRASRIADENNIEQYINQIFSELKQYQTESFIADRFNITVGELKKAGGLDKGKLLNNKEFKELIIQKQKTKKELFLKYIKQEVDFNEKFGFVDLNGSGRTQDNLSELINKEIRKCKIDSFYFNLQSDMTYRENSIKSAYINSINLNSIILELLCRTLHGQTLGYKESENKIQPVLEYDCNPRMEKWGFKDYINGLEDYTKIMAKEDYDDITLCMEYLDYAAKSPDKEIADIIGSIPFGEFGDEKNIREFIPAYNIFNLLKRPYFPKIAAARTNIIMKYFSLFINKITDKKTYGYISKKRDLAYIKIGNKKINIRGFLWK